MLDFLVQNWGNILVIAIVVGLIFAVVLSMVNKRKKGKSCTCGCANCPSASMCHSKKK